MKVNSTEVRFSLRLYPDLQVISERVARRPEHGALVREVRRLLRLALLAEQAGFTEEGLVAEVPLAAAPHSAQAPKAPAARRTQQRTRPEPAAETAAHWLDDPSQFDTEPLEEDEARSAEPPAASSRLASSPPAIEKPRTKPTPSQSGFSGFLA